MELQEILVRIQAHGYGTDTTAQQIQFVNDSYNEVNGKQRWPFLEENDQSLSTVPGQYIYSLASLLNFRQVDAVRFNDGADFWEKGEYVSPQQWRDEFYRQGGSGNRQFNEKPARWTIIDQSLHILPVPDGVYTIDIDYVITPPELLNPTDISLWPDDYDDILVWGAIRSLAYRERDWLGRNFAQTEFETRLSRMNEEYMVRQRQTSSEVIRSGYNDVRPIMPWAVGWGG